MGATREQIERTIAAIVRERLELPVEREAADAPDVLAALRLDSMAILDLIVHLEDVFGVEIIDEELNAPEQCRDIRSLAQLVQSKLSAAGR
jgi:acyl carrier protein